jgi:DnaJ family protein A protein 5
MNILFDVVPYQHAGCYSGYGNDDQGYYQVYGMVFEKVFDGENDGWASEGNIEAMPLLFLPRSFGNADSEWSEVSAFYQAWESFSSCLAFAWADQYDVKEAPNRRIRRAMDEENKKARRVARRERNESIEALVHFVKRRDPRIKAHRAKMEEEKYHKDRLQKEEAARKKEQAKLAREEWKRNAELQMAQTQEEDRLSGRVRLADLDDEYDFLAGGKRGKRKQKKGKIGFAVEAAPEPEEYYWANSDDEKEDDTAPAEETGGDDKESSTEEKGTRLTWRCECCKKNFDNEDLLANHSKGRSHREAREKYLANQKELKKQQAEEIEMQAKDYLVNGGGKRKGKKKPNIGQHVVKPEADTTSVVASAVLTSENEADDETTDGNESPVVNTKDQANATIVEKKEPVQQSVWRCEYCMKDFLSYGQMQHHTSGKKHLDAVKLHEAELEQKKAKEMQAILDEQALELAEQIRLAALEDDYDYLGGGKRKDKKKKEKARVVGQDSREQFAISSDDSAGKILEQKDEVDTNDEDEEVSTRDDNEQPVVDEEENYDDDEGVEDESDWSEPEVWSCECCRKEFKSEGQMVNHLASKKHKDTFRKFEAQQKRLAAKERDSLLNELVLDP